MLVENTFKVLDLFSGIGGFSLGLEATGMFQTVAFCEIDPYAQKVLRKNWPGVSIYHDVRKLKAEHLSCDVDLICGGFPCQPYSQAGKQRGESDERDLWPQFKRVISEFRPTWVIGENVANFSNMGLDKMLSDLEDEGYSSKSFIIPAVGLDAPHRRERTWVISHSNSKRLEGYTWNKNLFDKQRRELPEPFRSIPTGSLSDNKPARWKPEPSIRRVGHGIPDRVDRIKVLGNSVIPQIPFILGEAIGMSY